jgi:hypothetical protein
MLVSAVAFWQIVLALHIAAVVAAFGVTFAYPLFVVAEPAWIPGQCPRFTACNS